MDFSRQTAHDWFSVACTISSCGCSSCNSRTIPWTEQTRQPTPPVHTAASTGGHQSTACQEFPMVLAVPAPLGIWSRKFFHLQSHRLVWFPGGLGWSQCQSAPVYLRNIATLHSPQQSGLRSRPLRKSLGQRSFGAPGWWWWWCIWRRCNGATHSSLCDSHWKEGVCCSYEWWWDRVGLNWTLHTDWVIKDRRKTEMGYIYTPEETKDFSICRGSERPETDSQGKPTLPSRS